MGLSARWLKCLEVGFVCYGLLAPGGAGSAQRTWDGGGSDSDWRTAANWDGSLRLAVPIQPGDTLTFPAGPTKLINTNDFGAGTNFNALIYSGPGYSTYGSAIGLSNGVSVTHGSGNTVLFLPITARQDQRFSVAGSGAVLILNGDLSIGVYNLTFDGAGNFVTVGEILNARSSRNVVRKNGSGRWTLLQQSNHDVPTIVDGGILAVESRMTNTTVTVNAGGILRGTGRIGSLIVMAGGVVAPGGAVTPDTLDCYGDVTLSSNSVFRVRLNGTSPGQTYDQLKVIGGAVTVGGDLEVIVSFTPAVGDRFTLIESAGRNGTVGAFAGLPQNAVFSVNGRHYRIRYGRALPGLDGIDGSDVTLEVVPGTSIWDGGGGLNRLWSQPLNWEGDTLPLPGDNVHFPTAVTTINDFPAGRLFGSITMGPGKHKMEGNAAEFTGSLNITGAADIDIHLPVTLGGGFHWTYPGDLTFHAPIALRGSQTFSVDHTNALLTIEQGVNLGAHNLTLHNQLLDRPGIPTVASLYLYGTVGGAGRLIKQGPGECRFWNTTNACSETIIDEGNIDGTRETIGPVVINSGGALTYTGDSHSLITVNAGGLLSGGGDLSDLVVRGTFAPARRTWVRGDLNMLAGSTYAVKFDQLNPTELANSFAWVTGQVSFKQPTLSVTLQYPHLALPRGSNYVILLPKPLDAATFAGLPEGSRFVAGNNSLIISYQNDIRLTANLPFQWDGGRRDGDWSTGANWTGNVAPIANQILIFPGSVAQRTMTNDFAPGIGFGGLAFDSLVFDGDQYTLRGNLVHLTNGIVQNAAGQNVIEAGVRLSRRGEIFVGSGGLLRLDGMLTNNVTLVKTGPGTAVLGGANANASGPVEVMRGNLDLAKSGVDAISGALAIGDGTNSAAVRLLAPHQLADTVNVIIRPNASLSLNGYDDSISQLNGAGSVALGGGRLAIRGGAFSGSITGTGGLTKSGPGQATLSGSNSSSFSGPTVVDGGILQIDGVQTSSALLLNSGTLMGLGRVGPIQSGLGGILQPGRASPVFQNYLRCQSVAFNASTTLRFSIVSNDPDFESSRLIVTGTVSLGGCILQARRQNLVFNPAPGTAFLVLDNDGADPIAGAFAGLPEGALTSVSGLPFRISYVGGTGNDVVLTRTTAPPATLTAVEYFDGRARIYGLGMPALEYRIQSASNLIPMLLWAPVGTATADSNGVFETLHFSPLPQNFYRAQSP